MGKRLVGKVALVTGSTSGIGRAIATLFAAEGAKVVLVGRRRAMGEAAVADIRAAGGVAEFFEADFESGQAVRDTVRFARRHFGRIDVLVNNAMSHVISWGDGKTAVDTTEEEWDRTLAVGLKAAFIASQEAIPNMIDHGGGAIITVGSIRSILPAHKGFAYDVVKAGLINLSRQLNLDFGRHGIRSNLICPGLIYVTPGAADRASVDPAELGQLGILQTVGRPGLPEDVAQAALFLASAESSFISGVVLPVDGGASLLTGFQVEPLLQEHYQRFAASPGGPEAAA